MEKVIGNVCAVHGYHWPTPLRTVKHHIWPQEFGGPTEPWNLVLVCDTGHYNVHAVLTALLKGQPLPRATRRERAIARAGYEAILEAIESGKMTHDQQWALSRHIAGVEE